MKKIILLWFLAIFGNCILEKNQTIYNKGDFYVSKNLEADFLQIVGVNSFLTCENLISRTLISEKYQSNFATGRNLFIKNIYPNNGNSTYVRSPIFYYNLKIILHFFKKKVIGIGKCERRGWPFAR